MIQPNFFNTLFVIPILNILIVFYKAFTYVSLPGAFGFAIIALTVFMRLLFHPFFKQQTEFGKKMNELKPKLDHISKKFSGNSQKIQEEQMKLYKEAGVNPASGCLTSLIQMPIFIGLYSTFSLFLNSTSQESIASINKVLYTTALHISSFDTWFFGISLTSTPANAKNIWYLLIPIVTGGLQFIQAHFMSLSSSTSVVNKEPLSKEKEKNNDNSSGDFQKAMNMQMKYFFPAMIGYFSYRMPVGLAIYWNIFTLFSIMLYRGTHRKVEVK